MLSHMTNGELAVAGIGGTVLGVVAGGILTYLAQRRSTKDAIRGQRQLANDERLWAKRVEVYPRFIDLINNHASAMYAVLERQGEAARAMDISASMAFTREFTTFFPIIIAFSGRDAEMHLQNYRRAARAVHNWVTQTYYDEPFRERLEFLEATSELVRSLRQELQSVHGGTTQRRSSSGNPRPTTHARRAL